MESIVPCPGFGQVGRCPSKSGEDAEQEAGVWNAFKVRVLVELSHTDL